MSDDIRCLTRKEIHRVVYNYIGVSQGYLGDFSYSSHEQFYPYYCDLDIDPSEYQGTTRQRFITILEQCEPAAQAKILRGVLEKYPVESSSDRTQERYDEIRRIIAWLEGVSTVIKDEEAELNKLIQDEVASNSDAVISSAIAKSSERVREDELIEGRIKSLRTQLETYQRNLNGLEEQEANYGVIDVPIRLRNEIEKTKIKINEIEEELANLIGTDNYLSQTV